jgi:hypothetical protein
MCVKIHIYIYIYVCVCVCVFCLILNNELINRQEKKHIHTHVYIDTKLHGVHKMTEHESEVYSYLSLCKKSSMVSCTLSVSVAEAMI